MVALRAPSSGTCIFKQVPEHLERRIDAKLISWRVGLFGVNTLTGLLKNLLTRLQELC